MKTPALELRKVGLAWVVLLYLLTGGLYSIYWIVSRGTVVYSESRSRFSRSLPHLFLGLLFIYMALPVLGSIPGVNLFRPGTPTFDTAILVMLGILGPIYLAVSKISYDIATLFGDSGCSRSTAILLSILGVSSPIYLQYYINRSDAQDFGSRRTTP